MPIQFTASNKETHKIKEMSSEELIYNYDLFIKKIIFYYDKQGKFFEDLYQSAVLEILIRQQKFDPSKGVFFCTYCKPYICEKIKTELHSLKNPVKMCYKTTWNLNKTNSFELVDFDELENIPALSIEPTDIDERNEMIKIIKQKINKSDLSVNNKKRLSKIVSKIENNTLKSTIHTKTMKLFHQIMEDPD